MATHLHATSVAAVATDDDATCSPRENGPTPLVPECDRPALHDSADRNPSQPHEELASLLPANPVDPVKSSTLYDRHVPWFAWPLLVASLIAFSSAAVVFASIPDVPTCTLAAWRLQLTTFLLTPAAVYQFLHLPADDRKRLRKDILLVLASGAFLGVHFFFWVWAIHHTSVTHAMLFSSSTPLLISIGTLALRKPISVGEIMGTCLSMVGVVLLTRASKVDQQVTLAGDLSAFLTAVFFCGYIIIGAHLRKWLPVFLYATPVTGFAALLLSVAALASGEATLSGSGNTGLFGWVADKSYLPKILYLAVLPGIVGHTGFNALLKWMPALLITLALTLEPLIGTLIGWSLGLAQVPGVWTYSGGAVLLGSTAIVIVAGDRRQQAAHATASESADNKPVVFFQDAAGDLESARDIELAEKQ